ncbi:MAG: 3-keto-5-aminohexanoate cleavage protein [Halioglobus sp.]|nr:3-keto-5-aminohexanoate cleavage protein [Halioglobus sp.]
MTGSESFAASRVMVMAAPNGARRSVADHPAIPITSTAIAECAERLVVEGASVLHLHVRDSSGAHTLDASRYRAAIEAIEDRTGTQLVIQVTTEAVGRYSAAEQMRLVRELRPEAVSLALRELCPDGASEVTAAAFFHWLSTEEIWPQFILYSADDVVRFDDLRRRGLLSCDEPHCLLVLGRYASQMQDDPAELDALLKAAGFSGIPWTVCCFGRREHESALRALAGGGHVRLGFENNMLLADGSVASDNAALIRQFAEATRTTRRRVASADEVREFVSGRH